MHQPMQPIIQHLFQVADLEDVSRERLEEFVEAHPSFGIGHYLLSRKLQTEGAGSFQSETQRTCLYFSNPLWLQWLLQSGGPRGAGEAAVQAPVDESLAVVSDGPLPVPPEIDTPPQTLAVQEMSTWQDKPVSQEQPAENVVTMAEEAYVEPMVQTRLVSGDEPAAGDDLASGNDPAAGDDLVSGNDPAAGDDLAEVLTEGGEIETFTAVEIASITAGEGEQLEEAAVAGNGEPSAAERLLRSIEEARELRESLQRINEDLGAGAPAETQVEAPAGASVQEPETAHVPEEPVLREEPIQPEEPILDEEPPFVLDEAAAEETPADTATPPAEPVAPTAGHVVPVSPVAESPAPASLEAQPPVPASSVAQPPAPTPASQDLLFEPYHTIDYFASQGIKLTLDENPSDALGRQLKSFTEWLKTMRRLPQKEREVVPDRVAEEAIQTYAAHSIEGRDVLTETMAEVLAKQGMREKARAVYEKLSLLNPDKRAYFAAKIEQLNIR